MSTESIQAELDGRDLIKDVDGVTRWDLAQLTDAERDVYVSVRIEGLRPRDLVDVDGRSESTIRTLLSRAERKIEGDQ